MGHDSEDSVARPSNNMLVSYTPTPRHAHTKHTETERPLVRFSQRSMYTHVYHLSSFV